MKRVENLKSSSISSSPAIFSMQKGKLPPQAVDLEEVVLGAMMIDKKGVDEVIDILQPDAFYKDSHKIIFNSIINLFDKQEPIDIKTVSHQLKREGKLNTIGGDYYLVELTQKVSSSAHIEFHSRIILQKFIQRRLIQISNEIIEDSYDETSDVFDLLDNAESKIYDISQGNLKKNTQTAEDLVIQAKQKIEEISKKEGLSGIASGFYEIDRLTSGWQPSDLVIIAARPGMGKTAFTLSMARNMSVENNIPVAFFSLEMSSLQLITRLISSETGLNSEKLRTGKLEKFEWEQLNVKVSSLENAPLYIDDTPSLSIFELRAKARRLSSQYGIKLIVLDYLQLMTLGSSQKSGNREQEISTISRNLKALAKELDIPIIALSQLSRAVELRGGVKRPILSDLRESGAIEQDADIVSFLYRPEYYKMDEWDDEDHSPALGQAEFIVAKHRNGGLNSIKLKFISSLGKFENLSSYDNPFEYESKLNQDQKVNPDQAFESGSYRSDDEENPF